MKRLLSFQRTYQERVRGEARKKWLQQIITAAQTSGASLDPVYKAVFQALFKVGYYSLLHPVVLSSFLSDVTGSICCHLLDVPIGQPDITILLHYYY